MAKRVTIMIEEALDKKLRLEQSKQIKETNASVSYSKVLNDALEKVL